MAYAPPHPRLSSQSDHPPSARFSLPSAQSRFARPDIYDRNLNKSRSAEVSGSAFAFLFSEVVQYTQKRVSGINDLERRLNTLGYRVGTRVLELIVWRAESSSKAPKREIRLLPALMYIHTQIWKAVFGKPADAIEKSVENADEYMIIDNDPPIERYISVPRDMSQLSCSSFTAGIVEAVLDGLGFPARVTAHNTPTTQHPSRTTILIKLDRSVLDREELLKIHTIDISPPLINSSCVWSSDLEQLQELFDCPYTGAITTRTATLDGFHEDASHAVAFTTRTTSTLNSYGYSPHPLSMYLSWIENILASDSKPQLKPFIISITASDPDTLRMLIQSIQHLRKKLERNETIAPKKPQIGVEFNTSCPNIPGTSPPSYIPTSFLPILAVLADEFSKDHSLTIGLKLPPYTYREQFLNILDAVKTCSYDNDGSHICPIAFFTCTNTLGNALLYSEQVVNGAMCHAVPTMLGGLGGELIHALALGNVHTFKMLLGSDKYSDLASVKIIGVGGVNSKEGAKRMYKAGAAVVGCATYFGKEGIQAFQMLI
ncbi:hypothetical protein APHAL10511_006193 [Amanita phalloides]|nr:hypothetical protein APHAL10511_006193 [Amanita phalloides]